MRVAIKWIYLRSITSLVLLSSLSYSPLEGAALLLSILFFFKSDRLYFKKKTLTPPCGYIFDSFMLEEVTVVAAVLEEKNKKQKAGEYVKTFQIQFDNDLIHDV